MTHDVSVMLADGSFLSKNNVELNFDADNGVLYLYSDQGIAYVNFKYCVQVGAVPSVGE